MAAKVHVTKASDVQTSTGQTDSMIRQGAIVDQCDMLCASGKLHLAFPSRTTFALTELQVMIAKPHSSSAVHHHGSQDTIVYALRGHGTLVSEGGMKRQNLAPGDFALIPAWAEHQEANDADEEVTWIITRSGRSPIVENLGGWGASK